MFAALIAVLGKPYFEHDDCLIFQVDSAEALELLKENYVDKEKTKRKREDFRGFDLTVTSPPYNIGKEYEENLPLEKYISWCQGWIEQIYQLTQPNGSFFLNLGYLSIPEKAKALPIPYLLWDKIPFFLIQEIVWNYGAGVAGKKFYSPRNEKFLWYVKNHENYTFNLDDVRDPNVKYPNQSKNGKKKVNPIGKNPTDVWQFPKVTSGAGRASKERTPHPAQFPAAVIERIIKASSNPGDVIFDPFLGSGTTASVAVRLGRKCVGFEIKEDYCKIAANRLKKELKVAHEPKISDFFQSKKLKEKNETSDFEENFDRNTNS